MSSESEDESEEKSNKSNEKQSENEYHDTATNWKYGGWLMSKSLEEL